MDLAKIEAGKIVLNYEPIDLLSLVRQACEEISFRANKKRLTVSQDFPDGKLKIVGDFDKLSQVVSNLLSNAFKFTEKGGITVEVKDLGEEVRCAVKDTGIGIAAENLPRLFSKFEQFGKRSASSEAGSGLGLAISKSIMEAMAAGSGSKASSAKEPHSSSLFPKIAVANKPRGPFRAEKPSPDFLLMWGWEISSKSRESFLRQDRHRFLND